MVARGSVTMCFFLLEGFPVVCVGAGWRRSVQLAQGRDPFILVLIALHRFFATFILYIC